MEESRSETDEIVRDVRAVFAPSGKPVSFFVMPDNVQLGATETLCRQAVRNAALAACTDALERCSGAMGSTRARRDKGWLKAYLAMLPDPSLRFDQALAEPMGLDPMHAAFAPLRAFLLAL